MTVTQCPLCGSERHTVLYQHRTAAAPGSCAMARCDACGHRYTRIPQEIDLGRLYAEGNYELIDTRGSLFDRILSWDDGMILRRLARVAAPGGKLLDFGCGKGQFLHRASLRGWRGKGVETAVRRAEFGRKVYGLEISTDEYQAGPVPGGPFDVVTLFHVLEHLPDPAGLVKRLVEGNLAPGGCLVVEVPLLESLQSRIAGRRWMHLDPPLHVSHFTKRSLERMLLALGLRPVKREYLSLHVGVLGMVQSLMSLFGYDKAIIAELKTRRTKGLLASLLAVLPFAVFLELLAVLFRRGGVIRVYCFGSPAETAP